MVYVTFEKQTSKKSGKPYLCFKINGIFVTADIETIQYILDLRASEIKEYLSRADGIIKEGVIND